MASSSAWKSPLSILIGARRNDDADLELRDDHINPSRGSTPPPAPAASGDPMVNTEPTTAAAGVAAAVATKSSSYFPFGFIYYKNNSTNTNNGHSNNSHGNTNGDGEAAVAPPRGAFPPPIQNSDMGEINGDYVASHPWYHQTNLTEDNNPDDNNYNSTPRRANKANKNTQWTTQKSILKTTFNLTNAIIGAGAMGLGGAFAASGGGISVVSLLGMAYLTKLSLDLIVDLCCCEVVKGRVQEFRENDVEEVEEEEIDFERESGAVEDGKNDLLGGPNENETDQNNVNTEAPEETQDGEDTNKRETSPLMAQEATTSNNNQDVLSDPLNLHNSELGNINRYDSLNANSAPNQHLPLINIDSDGNPLMNLQTPVAKEPKAAIEPCTYEELGRAAYGSNGRMVVLISKCLYSFGCLVAYVVVVRDNFGPALRRMVSVSSLLTTLFTPHEIGCDNGTDFELCQHNLTQQNTIPTWLQDDNYLALLISATIMLPLSCPRTMEPLAKFSFISVLSIMFLALSVIYLYFSCTDPMSSQSTFYENWIEIRSFSGFFQALGTFVFTFVCHHVVNIAYESLPVNLRNPKTWRLVSLYSIVMSTEASLAIGMFAYMTFGANTPADVLLAYPPDIALANVSRLLLCLTMVLTFPLPFLTCREMLVLIMVDGHRMYHVRKLSRYNVLPRVFGWVTVLRRKLWTFFFKRGVNNDQLNVPMEGEGGQEEGGPENHPDAEEGFVEMQPPVPVRKRFTNWGKKLFTFKRETDDEWWDPAQQPLLYEGEAGEDNNLINSSIGGMEGEVVDPSPLSSPDPSTSSSEECSVEESIPVVRVPAPSWLEKDGNGRQLSFLYHAGVTFTLWMLATTSAIKAPSLGDVLDLVGAFTGTLLAFVLPALFSFKLRGYSRVSFAILSIGGFVGVCGTISSLLKFISDAN